MGDPPIRCHYEVLNVDRKATYDEIRAAYKKMALVYHPDKNHGAHEEAALKFKEVQNSYSVLSDTDDRAWYDGHRESILRGDDGGTCAPDEVNVFEFMTPKCFKGFGDADPQGFFQVFAKLFSKLREEESIYDDRARSLPAFGDSTTPITLVADFYRVWKNFSSFKNFAWKDEYKVSEIPDRHSRRIVEREQEKERNIAKKEYVEAVQHLALFVWKRDPRIAAENARVAAAELVKQEEKDKRELESMKGRQEQKKKMWAEAAQKEMEEERDREERGDTMDGSTLELMYERQRQIEKLRKQGKNVDFIGGQGISDMVQDDVDDNDDGGGGATTGPAAKQKCDACKKSFGTPAQWKEHVNSSKHKAKIKQLQAKGVVFPDEEAVVVVAVVPPQPTADPPQPVEGAPPPLASSADVKPIVPSALKAAPPPPGAAASQQAPTAGAAQQAPTKPKKAAFVDPAQNVVVPPPAPSGDDDAAPAATSKPLKVPPKKEDKRSKKEARQTAASKKAGKKSAKHESSGSDEDSRENSGDSDSGAEAATKKAPVKSGGAFASLSKKR